MKSEIYSPIPERTWRWLGVNAARYSEPVTGITSYAPSPLAAENTYVKPIEALTAEAAALLEKAESAAAAPAADYVTKNRNSGSFVEIPAHAQADAPLHLDYVLDAENPVLIDEQAIIARAGSRATVVLVYRGEGAFHRGLTRIYIEPGAELHLVKVQLLSTQTNHADSVGVYAAGDAHFRFTAIEPGAAESATTLLVQLAGENGEADCETLYFGDGERRIDMNYILRQMGRHTKASMEVRGALLGRSEKIFRGTLDFQRGSRGSVGRENEEVVLLSPTVRNRSVPLMLSGEDDVDGHHAVSVGKMDQNKLFYLMSRGLDMTEAQRLVVEAAFAPVIGRVPLEALRDEIHAYIQGRLSNG